MVGISRSLVLNFFWWWYGEALTKLLVFLKFWLMYLTDLFSVRICLRTLLAPWKRDQSSYNGLSLAERFQVWLLNQSSRFVGLIVKLLTLITFLIVFAIAAYLACLIVVFWLIWPLLAVTFILSGSTIILGNI